MLTYNYESDESGTAAGPVTFVVRYPQDLRRDRVRFTLPDYDVFEIDAMAPEPVTRRRFSGVGTTLFNMSVNPVSGVVYVTNQEARNLVRFEVARVRALFERARPLVDVVGSDLAVELALTWHGGMRILDKIEHVGKRLFAQRPHLNAADKALVVARAIAWRGETLPPRSIHLAQRLFDR